MLTFGGILGWALVGVVSIVGDLKAVVGMTDLAFAIEQ